MVGTLYCTNKLNCENVKVNEECERIIREHIMTSKMTISKKRVVTTIITKGKTRKVVETTRGGGGKKEIKKEKDN